MVHGLPRRSAPEFSAEKALQLLAGNIADLPFAESRNEMNVKHVAVVFLGCVFEGWQNHGRPVLCDKSCKGAD